MTDDQRLTGRFEDRLDYPYQAMESVKPTKKSSIKPGPGYKMELHKPINQGSPDEDVVINDVTISRDQLIGAVISEIIPDDIGDIFIFKLKDGREITVIEGVDSENLLFLRVVNPDEPFDMKKAYSLSVVPTDEFHRLLKERDDE